MPTSPSPGAASGLTRDGALDNRYVRCMLCLAHKPLSQFSILSSAAGSAQIAVSSQSGDCSVTDEFQSTHLRLTRLVNSELTAACMHGPVTAGCDDLQNGRGSQYCGARISAPSERPSLLVLGTESRMGARMGARMGPPLQNPCLEPIAGVILRYLKF